MNEEHGGAFALLDHVEAAAVRLDLRVANRRSIARCRRCVTGLLVHGVSLTADQAGQVHELAGVYAFTMTDLAVEVSRQTGTSIVYTDLSEDAYRKNPDRRGPGSGRDA